MKFSKLSPTGHNAGKSLKLEVHSRGTLRHPLPQSRSHSQRLPSSFYDLLMGDTTSGRVVASRLTALQAAISANNLVLPRRVTPELLRSLLDNEGTERFCTLVSERINSTDDPSTTCCTLEVREVSREKNNHRTSNSSLRVFLTLNGETHEVRFCRKDSLLLLLMMVNNRCKHLAEVTLDRLCDFKELYVSLSHKCYASHPDEARLHFDQLAMLPKFKRSSLLNNALNDMKKSMRQTCSHLGVSASKVLDGNTLNDELNFGPLPDAMAAM